MKRLNHILQLLLLLFFTSALIAQKSQPVKLVKNDKERKVDVTIGGKLFTTFMYTDTMEKPFLYPLYAANGTMVTRGFPLNPKPGEPTDHPHHIGLWLNYESVNGLDFWNNSFAIPAERKKNYGWIKTDQVLRTRDGELGLLTYRANWTNQAGELLLEETTSFLFSGTEHQRVIDRSTVLVAKTDVKLADVKDGLLGLRLAQELQIPAKKEQKFTDDKGNVTVVKVNADGISNGNYMTSEGKQGDDAWSTRAAWCKVYGKMKSDSISVTILDHPSNVNFPTFWHARGYGLFAANPLGEKVFTNGKSALNKELKKGESIRFNYRIRINNGAKTPTNEELNKEQQDFGKTPADRGL
jgi:hypothetical protein